MMTSQHLYDDVTNPNNVVFYMQIQVHLFSHVDNISRELLVNLPGEDNSCQQYSDFMFDCFTDSPPPLPQPGFLLAVQP